MIEVAVDRGHPATRVDAGWVLRPDMTLQSSGRATSGGADVDDFAVITRDRECPLFTFESPRHLLSHVGRDRCKAIKLTWMV